MKLKVETLEELVEILGEYMPRMNYDFRYIKIRGRYREAYKLYGYLCLHDVESYQLTSNIIEVIVDRVVYHIANSELDDKVSWFMEILSDTVQYVNSSKYD